MDLKIRVKDTGVSAFSVQVMSLMTLTCMVDFI